MKALSALLFLVLVSTSYATSEFFQIKDVKFIQKPGKNGGAIDVTRPTGQPETFLPCLEAKLATSLPTQSKLLNITAVFFDETNKALPVVAKPAIAHRDLAVRDRYAVPAIFSQGKAERIFFTIPKELDGKKWSAVVIFGDQNEASAKRYPDGPIDNLTFAQKDFVLRAPQAKVERKAMLDPVIEHVVRTQNPKHPQITLLLRAPSGVTDPAEIQGVLAMCVLANSVGDMHRRLQERKLPDTEDLLSFADQHKLAILCWGASTLWNPAASYDELDHQANEDLDRSFDEVADAWERGIFELHEKYGIPTKNYLLWGLCAAGQWAHRLALRKPDYFLAVAVHIPSSFDQPTPAASKILWLLTSGELDGGYARGIRFYKDCRAMGYPIMYKAVVGLGHACSPVSSNLELKFFEYAWSVRDQRTQLDQERAKLTTEYKKAAPEPWLASFKNPEYVGDLLNQEMFPEARKDMVPTSLRVPLPNKVLADAWNK